MTEKDYAVRALSYSIDHLKRIMEDMSTQEDLREIRYLLQEARSTADALKWDVEGRLRRMTRQFAGDKIKK